MIINLLISFVILFLGILLSWLPVVEKFPTIGGFDIDSALVLGISQMKQFFITFWPLQYMFYGFLFLMGYYLLKAGVQFFLGNRAPGTR